MARRKLPYKEGDWFAVPLRDGGYTLGRVARMDGRGGIIGYFFGPRHEQLPTPADVEGKEPSQAIWIANLGDLGFLEGTWHVISTSGPWRREQWPMPLFKREDLTNPRRAWRVQYSESNFHRPVSEEAVTPDEVRDLPEDAVEGSGSVERWLTHVLSK
jgi:hypothetical protein